MPCFACLCTTESLDAPRHCELTNTFGLRAGNQMDTKEYLFVYGSLRNPSGLPKEMADLISQCRRCGSAQVRGKLYDFSAYCGAVLDNNTSMIIYGDLLELPTGDKVFDTLDRYEEIDPLSELDSLFVRQETQVHLGDGAIKEAWIYVYNKPTGDAPLIEGGDYQRHKTSQRART